MALAMGLSVRVFELILVDLLKPGLETMLCQTHGKLLATGSTMADYS